MVETTATATAVKVAKTVTKQTATTKTINIYLKNKDLQDKCDTVAPNKIFDKQN